MFAKWMVSIEPIRNLMYPDRKTQAEYDMKRTMSLLYISRKLSDVSAKPAKGFKRS